MAIQTDTQQPEAQRYRGDYQATQSVYAPEPLTPALVGRVSWGAVSAGAALALATQLVLNLFGMGVGFAAAEPGAEMVTAAEASWGTLIWMAVTGVIAAFAGGFCSGRLAGERRAATAGWHGLVSWAASILIIAVLAATVAGALVGGNMRMMTMEIGAPAAAAPAAAPDATAGPTAPDATVAPPAVDTAAVDETALARMSLFCAIALALGACAGWLGGRAGAVDPDDLERDFSRAVH